MCYNMVKKTNNTNGIKTKISTSQKKKEAGDAGEYIRS